MDPDVVAHWHKLINGLEASPLEFYHHLERRLAECEIKDLKTDRVDLNEGGLLAAKREYLRVQGEHHVFDVCAAPYGRGFFFSSWLRERPARLVPLYIVAFIGLAALFYRLVAMLAPESMQAQGSMLLVLSQSIGIPLALLIIAAFGVMLLVALTARLGFHDPSRAMETFPLVGGIYRAVFSPATYYRIDTMLMFKSAVHAAMMEVINGLLTTKGLRALNEAESKPLEKQLVDRRHALPESVLTTAASAN